MNIHKESKMQVNEIKSPLEKNFVESKPLAGFAFSRARHGKTVKGFTLMEIVVSLIILATVFGGLTASFIGVKRYVARANRRLVATNLSKQALNALYVQVRGDTWNTGPLSTGGGASRTYNFGANTQVPTATVIDNFSYGDNAHQNSYTVRTVNTNPPRQYREVTTTVWYPTE
ncbi:MAG: type II secretion system protein [Candidatus Omnitrophica bacterium]|nr:type II secretion system protein [Candidatus Omnitrophota bacterium]